MPRNPESRGACSFCGEIVTKRGVVKHLEKCPKWLEQLQAAETSSQPYDVFLSDATRLAEKASQSGVAVTLKVWDSMEMKRRIVATATGGKA